jgi:hypothetical protein
MFRISAYFGPNRISSPASTDAVNTVKVAAHVFNLENITGWEVEEYVNGIGWVLANDHPDFTDEACAPLLNR